MSSQEVTYNVLIVILCIVSAAGASGLTQGLLSLDAMEMEIKRRSGTPKEQKYAAAVLPLITRHHLLLVSLMLWNATAMEALPLFLDKLVPAWLAIILSVTMVLFVGEIMPAAVLTGPNQLQIAASLSTVVYIVLFIFFPIAYPISLILDALLGHDEGVTTYNKLELSTLVQLQHEEVMKKREEGHVEEGVDADETHMIESVLKFREMLVKDAMTRDLFMLPIDEKFSLKTLNKIYKSGYSRVPVYGKDRNDVVGLIMTKDLLFIDPEDELPLRSFLTFFSRPIQTVWPDQTLGEVFKLFKASRGHMAIVVDVNNTSEFDPFYEVKGLITMEDVFEKMIGKDFLDETDMLDENNRVVKFRNRDIEITRMRLIDPTLMDSDNKLSREEIQAITAHLHANVPKMLQLTGNDQDVIEQLVVASTLVEAKRVAAQEDNSRLPVDRLYERGVATEDCILILGGKVLVLAGKSQLPVEMGPWTTLGQDALVAQSKAYVPDFSAYILSDKIRYLKLAKQLPLKRRNSFRRKISGRTPVKPSLKASEGDESKTGERRWRFESDGEVSNPIHSELRKKSELEDSLLDMSFIN